VRVAPAEPQVSTRGLQFTGFTPIQPLPSIKEVTAQTRTLSQQVMNPQPAAGTPTVAPSQSAPADVQTASADVETQNVASPDTPAGTATNPAIDEQDVGSQQSSSAEADTTSPSVETQNDTPQQTTPAETESFEECWNKMVDFVFAKKPAFYHQLRDYLPRFENEIIYVDVENDFQKNQLEMSKRAMLEYWRNQFQLNVNDIEFVIHEHEKKKVIYTSEDKVNNMLEQNPELKDFLQVLNFRIKD
jgi:hypothetical protein